MKNNSPAIKKRVVPTYNFELKEALLEKFYMGSVHFKYYKTYIMIYEQHIGITQNEVKKYMNECSTCIQNRSIKKKSNLTPVVFDSLLVFYA